jgi:hypothetical protein
MPSGCCSQLTAKGMVQTNVPAETHYMLMFSYSADGGRTMTSSMPICGFSSGGASKTEMDVPALAVTRTTSLPSLVPA